MEKAGTVPDPATVWCISCRASANTVHPVSPAGIELRLDPRPALAPCNEHLGRCLDCLLQASRIIWAPLRAWRQGARERRWAPGLLRSAPL